MTIHILFIRFCVSFVRHLVQHGVWPKFQWIRQTRFRICMNADVAHAHDAWIGKRLVKIPKETLDEENKCLWSACVSGIPREGKWCMWKKKWLFHVDWNQNNFRLCYSDFHSFRDIHSFRTHRLLFCWLLSCTNMEYFFFLSFECPIRYTT